MSTRFPCRTEEYGSQQEAQLAKILCERSTRLMHEVYVCAEFSELHFHVQRVS
jgi:hypothetical protein